MEATTHRLTVRGLLTLYAKLLATALSISAAILPFLYALAQLPYRTPAATTAMFILATTAFGPVYLVLVACFMAGWRRAWASRLVYSAAGHAIVWPLAYGLTSLVGGYAFWYHYLDFAWFGVAFLPISFQIGYRLLGEDPPRRRPTDAEMYAPAAAPPEGEPTPAEIEPALPPGEAPVLRRLPSMSRIPILRHFSPRWRVGLMFMLSECVVIVSALSYSLLLFPIYAGLESDVQRAIWRMTLHPFWFEATMYHPQRLIATREFARAGEWRFLPILHSLFHRATIGWMLINTIRDPYASAAVTLAKNLQEFLLRTSAYKRDFLVFRAIYGTSQPQLRDLHAVVVHVEMITELVGICTMPALMLFFDPHGPLFSWYSGPAEAGTLVAIMCGQLAAEAVTDCACLYLERGAFDLAKGWRVIQRPLFLAFLFYGCLSMGILGMIYTGDRTPRALYCSRPDDLCSCSYAKAFAECVT